MKKIIYLFIILSSIVISCNSKNNKKQNEIEFNTTKIIPRSQKSIKEIEVDKNQILLLDFKKFREAVYQGKKEVVKTYIDFPISGNSINYELLPIFYEKNFEKDFNVIFPKEFISSILKIKTEKLFKDGKFETKEIDTENGGNYKCYARIIDSEVLQLNISFIENIYDVDGSLIEDAGEYNYIYEFEIKKNKLKLKSRIFAG